MTLASAVTASLWLPIAALWFLTHPPTLTALLLATACGFLSSIVPYVAELQAQRRITASLFGTFTSVNPVWAALAWLILMQQAIDIHEWIGIALIVASNIIVSVRGLRPRSVL